MKQHKILQIQRASLNGIQEVMRLSPDTLTKGESLKDAPLVFCYRNIFHGMENDNPMNGWVDTILLWKYTIVRGIS